MELYTLAQFDDTGRLIASRLSDELIEGWHLAPDWFFVGMEAWLSPDGAFLPIDQKPVDLGPIEERLKMAIDTERTARIAAGMPYSFPDGTDGTVQLRHERDILNVNAVGTAAMMMISAGDTTTKLDFRDQEDVTHQLTAHEMLAMAQDVMGWISAHYAAAWAHKDAVKALVEAGDLEGVSSYDITQGWPA